MSKQQHSEVAAEIRETYGERIPEQITDEELAELYAATENRENEFEQAYWQQAYPNGKGSEVPGDVRRRRMEATVEAAIVKPEVDAFNESMEARYRRSRCRVCESSAVGSRTGLCARCERMADYLAAREDPRLDAVGEYLEGLASRGQKWKGHELPRLASSAPRED